MTKATWGGAALAESDACVIVEGNSYFPAEAVARELTSLDNPGFCLACGAESEGCEADAEQYECESCGAAAVYGAQEILLAIA